MDSDLEKIRIEKGISLNEISSKLNIPEKFLLAIEGHNFDRLPAPIFAKSQINKYCSFLDLDPSTILIKYEEFLKEKNFSNDDEKLESSESFLLNLIRFISERKITFLSLTIFSLIILTYFIFNASDEKNEINALEGISSEEQEIYENEIISDSFITKDENTMNNVIDDQIVFEKDPEIPIIDIDFEEDDGNISLENGSSDIEIIVQGESWVEIIDDEQILLFELLQTGFYEVTGYGPFKFKIGHSPSVKIYLNGNNIDFSKTVSKYTDYAHFLYKDGVAVELFKD